MFSSATTNDKRLARAERALADLHRQAEQHPANAKHYNRLLLYWTGVAEQCKRSTHHVHA